MEYALRRTGPMKHSAVTNSAPSRAVRRPALAEHQFHVQPLARRLRRTLHNFNAFTASVCSLNRPAGRRIRLKTAPLPTCTGHFANYLSTAEGPASGGRFAAHHAQIVESQGALARYRRIQARRAVPDRRGWRGPGDIATTIFSPVNKSRRADDRWRWSIRTCGCGVRGLRVVDAGVMPLITSGNTELADLMIAEAAQWIQAGIWAA
jgi:choline dehydrogenase